MEIESVTLQIFGRTLKFNCPASEVDELHSAAKSLDQCLTSMREKSPQVNSEQLIMSAALNIAYELAKEKQKRDEFGERLKTLQQLLDSALNIDN